MNTHEHYMQRCLDLAIKGLGHVAPNPMVGCVIVHDDKIIGEGYHHQFGGPHAEVNAINSVEEQNLSLLQQSTLYVNLEPCSHHGKTPPCADLVIAKGIPRVVIGSFDPNTLVAGRGIEKLRAVGVEVIQDVLKAECDFLNRRFITFHTQQRPYIILKWTQSADGFMGLEEPKQVWLSNDESKKLMHKWRSEELAIMVGKNTVLIDDPQLTARLWQGKNPLRVTFDRNLEMPANLKIFNADAPTLVFNEKENSVLENIERVKIDFANNAEEQVLKELHKRNILSVIIEGGPALLNSFIAKSLWDEAQVFTTPHLLIKGKSAPQLASRVIQDTEVEGDKLVVKVRV